MAILTRRTALASAVSGTLAVANGGTGTVTGSITGTTALTFTAGGTNQAINLEPTGTGSVTTTKTFTAQGYNASQTGYYGFNSRALMSCNASNVVGFFLTDFVTPAAIQASNIRIGTGTPEGAVSAPVGTIFSRTDGGANTSLYIKQSGTGNTGWAAVTP